MFLSMYLLLIIYVFSVTYSNLLIFVCSIIVRTSLVSRTLQYQL